MPEDLEPDLKPEIGHILSIDVVGYSKLLVNEQIALVKQLNQVVRDTSCFRAAEKSGTLIRLPTGDGMVLIFFHSPEEPLRCAVEISEALRGFPHIRVRMGAHSGPVNEIEDVNDKANVAGAGVNTAQRVLDCGDAGHILLSKRLAEDLAEYGHWRPHLHDLGECLVKHGVKLQLVNFYNDSVGNSDCPAKLKDSACFPAPPRPRSRRGWLAAGALLALILAAAILLLVRSRVKPLPPVKSVAVLPFQSLSDEHRDAYFADGVQDEILTDLAKVADLKVISRTSVMKYRNSSTLNLRQIAEALRVRYVLEGSVQRVANSVRVSAQLLDATTDAQIWAEHYDRQLSDVFAIQSEIAEKIVSQLQARLTPEEKAAIEVRPTDDIKAYELYVEAKATIDRVIYDSNHIEDLPEAAQLLEQATLRDPRFFLAFCQLAYVHDQIYFNSIDHTSERLALAQAALDSAQRLQPDMGEYHLAAAAHYYFGYLDYDRARQELVIAQRKLPNDPYTILLLGYVDRRQGRWDESTKELERTVELTPGNLLFLKQLALSYNILRRYPDMEKVLDRAIALSPNDPNFLVQRADVDLEWRADTKPLHDVVDRVVTQDPANGALISDVWMTLALCEKDAKAATRALEVMSEEGCQEEGLPYPRSWCEGIAARQRNDATAAQLSFSEARIQVDRLVQRQPDFAAGLSALGMIDAALGNKEKAIAEGRRAVELLPVSKDAIRGTLLLQNLATIYAWTGEIDASLDQLKQLVKMPSYLSYGLLRLHPYWEPLRKDPRFDAITQALSPKPK